MPTQYAIEPIEGESYKGRQWGFHIVRNGEPYLRVSTGGTGACWNVSTLGIDGQPDVEPALHICDLDSFVNAMLALFYSDAERAHCERWQEPRSADERPIQGIGGDRQAHVYSRLLPEPVRVSSMDDFEQQFGPTPRLRIPALEREPVRPRWWRRLFRTRARRK